MEKNERKIRSLWMTSRDAVSVGSLPLFLATGVAGGRNLARAAQDHRPVPCLSDDGGNRLWRMLAGVLVLLLGFFPSISRAIPLATASHTGLEHGPWHRLADLPSAEGVSGPYVGVSAGRLVLAGGTNFVGGRQWNGGRKTWHDTIYVLDAPGSHWKIAGHLPRPLGYGAAVSWGDGLLCLGGCDANRCYADAFWIRFHGDQLTIEPFTPLPVPSAHHAAIIVGDSLYVVGGQPATNARPRRVFWRLDLKNPDAQWELLKPWPGPGRAAPIVGVLGNSLYVFGGHDLVRNASGVLQRKLLQDAYCLVPGHGWKRCADLPRPVAGTPSPALRVGANHLVLLGWNPGTWGSIQPPETRPNTPADRLIYDAARDQWRIGGRSPFSNKVTPVVRWRNLLVIASGEIQPSVRTPNVWSIANTQLSALLSSSTLPSPSR